MARIPRMHYRSWDQYKHDIVPELFGSERFRSGAYLFRGCGDADWTLTTTFDRRFGSLPAAKRLRLWARMLQSFRAACEERGVADSVLRDDTRLLAFGQHHGLPTRLLDWSLSPYIAAFFAFRQSLLEPDPGGQVAIWVLDSGAHIWSAELGVEISRHPRSRTSACSTRQGASHTPARRTSRSRSTSRARQTRGALSCRSQCRAPRRYAHCPTSKLWASAPTTSFRTWPGSAKVWRSQFNWRR